MTFENSSSLFITTEVINKAEPGKPGEITVFEAVKEAFKDRDCLGFFPFKLWNEDVGNGKLNKIKLPDERHYCDADIFLIDRELGIIIIEVKSFLLENFDLKRSGGMESYEFKGVREGKLKGEFKGEKFYRWKLNPPIYKPKHEAIPHEQALKQLSKWLQCLKRVEPINISEKVTASILVATPNISRSEWERKWDAPSMIFKDELSPQKLLKQVRDERLIVQKGALHEGVGLEKPEWDLLCNAFASAKPVEAPNLPTIELNKCNNRKEVAAKLSNWIAAIDIQGLNFAYQIPPGPQRLRGVAGSAKTLLLCKKAAWMHYLHRDWKIALVFNSRSLHEQVETLVSYWVKFFSGSEYDKAGNLSILHAWGGEKRAGFYSTICKINDAKFYPYDKKDGKDGKDGIFIGANKLLFEKCNQLEQFFDAVLIDEGQDLTTADDALMFEGKQPFYWMAWQSLKESIPNDPSSRRLIWAYDEAQNFGNLKIPTAKELFGSEFSNVVKGSYKGDIQKSIIREKCYRTPAMVLLAASALGMGFFRPKGMLTGMTTRKGWKDIGYEVEGSFSSIDKRITLRRSPENSPNPLREFSAAPPLTFTQDLPFEFEEYPSREAELEALAKNIHDNHDKDKLDYDRHILVIVLGNSETGVSQLQDVVHEKLEKQGIPCHRPGKEDFWKEGHVTISHTFYAKGNEAYMVYVVGLNVVAEDESNIALRNQLYCAMTRTHAWLKLSGFEGHDSLNKEAQQVYEELRKNTDEISFTYSTPRHDRGEVETEKPILKKQRYSGDA